MGILSRLTNLMSARGRAQSLYDRGLQKAKKEDYAGAIEDYTALIRMDNAPEDLKAMALFNRGLALSITKDTIKATDDLQKVISMHGAPGSVVTAAREKLERIKMRQK